MVDTGLRRAERDETYRHHQDPAPRVDGGARWGLAAALWFTLVASLASLHPIFEGASWWFAGAVVSALIVAALETARSLRWPLPGVFATGLVVAAIACTVTVSGGTALLGFIPTSATLDRVALLTQQARDAIVSDQAPVTVSTALLGVIVVSMAAATLIVDLLARVGKMPGLTGVVFAVVVVVPSLVPDTEPSWFWVVAAVIGFAVVLLVSTGRRPSRSAVVTGVAAVAVAGIVTSVVPVSPSSVLQGVGTGTGISTGVNPVINLGRDLRRGSPVQVLSYKTTSTDGEYLKLVDLVDFSGTRWSPKDVSLNADDTVDTLPSAPGISKTTRRVTETTDVSVSLLRSPYLPIPVPATTITGIDDKWKYVDASGVTVRSKTEGSQGLDYTVRSRPVDPTRSQIVRSLGETPADLSAYKSVAGVPRSITELAKKVTADAANPFDAAVDLQNYFRDGDFTYSESTPVKQGYDGSGLDMVETFLKTKSGYCVHFASAMAVMARTLGIPSRIAVGFLPGTQEGSTDEWTVTSNDLHTWPELYFQGLGWVPFEPTVGQGTTSAYLQQTGAEATPSASATVTPSDSATAEPTDQAVPTTSATPTASDTPSAGAAAATETSTGPGVLLTAALIVLVVLALCPWWLRSSRRRRRLGVGPPDAALSAWREVVDTARDLGASVDSSTTPTVVAGLLEARLDEASAVSLEALLWATEAERFGGSPATTSVHDDARRVIAGLRASSSPVRRLWAALAPHSLFVEQRPRTAQ